MSKIYTYYLLTILLLVGGDDVIAWRVGARKQYE